ncbi:hypothetical protein BH10PSE3_BH10PSE3_27920 [soil metagenome]
MDVRVHGCFLRDTLEVDIHQRPAHDVECNVIYRLDAPLYDVDQSGTLWPSLADVATLKVAGEDDVGVRTNPLETMDVAQRPILIALRGELIGMAWRIWSMPAIAGQSGMQDAYIESTGYGRRIACRQIPRIAGLIALAVQRHPGRRMT